MTKDKAQMLLDSIITLADAQSAVEGHGNSGEFCNLKELKECEESLEKSKKDFIEVFIIITGWKPVYHEVTEASKWRETWTLEKA